MIHTYTSTGAKYWKHSSSMENYLIGTGNSIISTHISPEGRCNLKCHFCSVSKRDKFERLELDTIKEYISKLISRGLKAVIITGGGEPVLYPHINELVGWLKDRSLLIALITNGTLCHNIDDWDAFSWVRVSLNDFCGWESKVNISRITGTLGGSIVYVGQSADYMRRVEKFTKNRGFRYIRLVPNCLVDRSLIEKEHTKIIRMLENLDTTLFFHQYKKLHVPCSSVCHQSYFRPYLHESGKVYPCDSVVLNNSYAYFDGRYSLCEAKDILQYLDGNINAKFSTKNDCKECVFADVVDMLDNWKLSREIKYFDEEVNEHISFV